MGRVAGGWLDIGEVEKARPLIREAWEVVAALPKGRGYDPDFLKAAARFELDRVLARIRDISNASLRRDRLIEVAESLASDHPAEAERVFQLVEDEGRGYQHKDVIALRLCRRMAKTDPERARRLIAGLKSPRQQACVWALLAFVLADRDKPAARSALDESIQLIDRLSGYPDRAEIAAYGAGIASVAGNPAASILPIVEKVAPERLEHVFCKAVALMPKHDIVRERRLPDSRIGQVAIFLARYDRQVAGAFVTEDMTYRSSQRIGYAGTIVRARASVRPAAPWR